MAHTGISAAVLIGGRSRRMGVPKALLRLEPHGETLIERTVTTLRDVAGEVVLVGTPAWSLPGAVDGSRRVADRGASAADGIVTALDNADHRFCVVVACDMPFLNASLLREMGNLALRARRGVIAVDARGSHPLHAVWDRAQVETIRAAIEQGERSLGKLARLAGMMPFDLEAAGRSDRERWSPFNVNTPDDLDIARAHAARTG